MLFAMVRCQGSDQSDACPFEELKGEFTQTGKQMARLIPRLLLLTPRTQLETGRQRDTANGAAAASALSVSGMEKFPRVVTCGRAPEDGFALCILVPSAGNR